MRWVLSHRADPVAVAIADRHYSRQKPGTPQFVPPGRCVVLRTEIGDALWVTSWPFAEYVRHAWAGAWINSLFRNESEHLSSDLIREALAATRSIWPDPPRLGLVTFIDTKKTRRKRDPGRCYRKAGFQMARCPTHGGASAAPSTLDALQRLADRIGCNARASLTKAGLVAVQMLPEDMPPPEPPLAAQLPLVMEN